MAITTGIYSEGTAIVCQRTGIQLLKCGFTFGRIKHLFNLTPNHHFCFLYLQMLIAKTQNMDVKLQMSDPDLIDLIKNRTAEKRIA